MTNNILLIPLIVSFLTTLLLMPFWIGKAKQIGLLWPDQNKSDKKKLVAGSGGIIVILGFLIGVLLYIAYRIFVLNDANLILVNLFASLTTILLLAGIGLIDDLLGWQHGGLSRRSRIILVGFAAIPLVAINAGKSLISLPLLGEVHLGLFYPLVFIPLGVIVASTTYNFLAGFNGLESGQGILILSALAIVAYMTNNSWLSVVLSCMVLSLLAFLLFNFYPAKVFPGDSLTYAVGGLIAISAIIGNFEKIAIFFFIPYIIETALKLRGGLVKQSFGKPTEDKTLELKYPKIYSLNHLAILILNKTKYKATEKTCVYLIWAFQLLIILLGFIIFRNGVF